MIRPKQVDAAKDFDVDVTATVQTGYDNNITLAEDNEKSDSVSDLTLGLALSQQGKRHQLNADASFSQQIYATHSSFNNNAQDMTLSYDQDLSKYDRWLFSNEFRHAEDPGSFEDNFGRASGRYSFFRNRFNTSYEHDLSAQTTGRVYYGNEWYDASRSDLIDSFANKGGLMLSHFFSSDTVGLCGYDYTHVDFDPFDDTAVHTWFTGLTYDWTQHLELTARAGLSYVRAISGDNSTEPNYELTVANTFNARSKASLTYRQANTPSMTTADVFDAWRILARAQHQIMERLGLSLSGFWGEGAYAELDITDRQSGVRSALNYDLKDNVALILGYRLTDVDSNQNSRSYTRQIVNLGVEMRF